LYKPLIRLAPQLAEKRGKIFQRPGATGFNYLINRSSNLPPRIIADGIKATTIRQPVGYGRDVFIISLDVNKRRLAAFSGIVPD
jgi:hypothetical protein